MGYLSIVGIVLAIVAERSASPLCNGPACSRPMRRTDRFRERLL
jgi:hypothetical protein